MRRAILLVVILISFSNLLFAKVLKGKISNVKTGEVLVGSDIYIKELKLRTVSGKDGSYFFKNVPRGDYEIKCSNVGYHSDEQKLTIGEAEIQLFDFKLEEKIEEISQVSITAHVDQSTDISARNSERNSNQVINIVSAKTIESLPDLNVADVLQRVSGVSMIKNSTGSNAQVVIRGMPPRYNSAMLNGVAMSSTSSTGRSASLDMIGSDLVERIEVIKSLTPEVEGDALGGTVNIKMKQASDKAFFKMEVGSGYNMYYTNHDFLTFDNSSVAAKDFSTIHGPDYLAQESEFPRKNLVVQPKKALPDLDLNFSGGRRFINSKLGVLFAVSIQNNSQANTYDYTSYSSDPNTNENVVDYWEHQVFSKSQKKYGGYIKLDYQFNANNQISLFSSLFQSNELRVREFSDRQVENGGQNFRPIETQTESDITDLSTTTLQGEHKISDQLAIDWTVLYSSAKSNSPDFASIILSKLGNNSPATLNYSRPVLRNWQWNKDENESAYLNINYKPLVYGHEFDFKAGGMARRKFRKNYANEYFFDPTPDYASYPNPDLLTVPLSNQQNDQQQKGNAKLNPGNYRAWEDIEAAYAMVTTSFGKFQILTGARAEFTYMTNQHNQNNLQVPVASSTLSYFDILPSLHLTYKITEKQNLRFSVYQAINRQGFTEIIPYSDPRAGGSTGNPNLQHATGNSVDLRYEIYPKQEEVFTAGVFYKQINNAIEEIVKSGSDNRSFQNIANCTNYGLELVFMKYFGNFGLTGNYTYTNSAVDVPKHYFVIENNVYQNTITKIETRPLVGQSPHLINVGLAYRNQHWGLKSSLTYTMQGTNLVTPSDAYGKDIYQDNYHNLGLSLEQKIGKRLSLNAKASNILNSPLERYIKDDRTVVEKSYNYQSIFIGLKYSI